MVEILGRTEWRGECRNKREQKSKTKLAKSGNRSTDRPEFIIFALPIFRCQTTHSFNIAARAASLQHHWTISWNGQWKSACARRKKSLPKSRSFWDRFTGKVIMRSLLQCQPAVRTPHCGGTRYLASETLCDPANIVFHSHLKRVQKSSWTKCFDFH